MTSAIDICLRNNAAFATEGPTTELAATPAMRLAIVACMDARVETGAALGLREGDAHVIRNAGGVVTDDVIRSLAVSQAVLGTREIMVIHHTDCGMLKFSDSELREAIESKTGARPPFAMETLTDLEVDLRRSIDRILTSPFVLHKTAVRGFVYDVATRRLREVRAQSS